MLPVRDTRGAVDPISPSLPDSVSLTFCIVRFVFVYMSLSVLAFCPAVATPPLSRCPSLPRMRSAMPRMQKSRSSVLRTQRYGRYILLSLTQPQWRLACFDWCQEFCLASLSESRSQLNIKWHASRPLVQFMLVSQCDTADAEIKVPSVENPEPTNVLPLKSGVG